jgi:hypothetical protein
MSFICSRGNGFLFMPWSPAFAIGIAFEPRG